MSVKRRKHIPTLHLQDRSSTLDIFANHLLTRRLRNHIRYGLCVRTVIKTSISTTRISLPPPPHKTHLGKNGATLISTTLSPLIPKTRKLTSTHVSELSGFPMVTVEQGCHILAAVLRIYSYTRTIVNKLIPPPPPPPSKYKRAMSTYQNLVIPLSPRPLRNPYHIFRQLRRFQQLHRFSHGIYRQVAIERVGEEIRVYRWCVGGV